jgi:hypothetical protein
VETWNSPGFSWGEDFVTNGGGTGHLYQLAVVSHQGAVMAIQNVALAVGHGEDRSSVDADQTDVLSRELYK